MDNNVQFDPYYTWLGITSADRPPDHYRLLGIDRFESNPDVIDHAADRQMSHVRKFAASEHGDKSQCLLNELSAARLCLLDSAQKAAYDDQLLAAAGDESSSPLSIVSVTKDPPRSKPLIPIISGIVGTGCLVLLGISINRGLMRRGEPKPDRTTNARGLSRNLSADRASRTTDPRPAPAHPQASQAPSSLPSVFEWRKN